MYIDALKMLEIIIFFFFTNTFTNTTKTKIFINSIIKRKKLH